MEDLLKKADMKTLITISRAIDRLNTFIGHSVSWLLLVAVLVSAGNAVSRKLFSLSSNAMLELQWYLFGAVFMLAAAYTLLKNEHIRIDILSGSWSKRTRDWIDLTLHIVFLVPFASMMVYLAWPWFWRSFASGEHSTNAGGLILWPAKSFILIGFILLLLQAFSEIIKRAGVLSGHLASNQTLYSESGNAAHMMTEEDKPE
ncbi:TRAP-type mannitol/chloroaromatic compound transport system permease small subunit [Martelella mediterranea]|uniref:TRAP transporter small permease protein n=2 Tax=Martelella mediterranea TaxID=293089 RepID=A0A4R3NW62_9HYPH|nr:TRAP-type mannitol/chloroaromatic compound transport system permease small subunit [Martelella mediterranea]